MLVSNTLVHITSAYFNILEVNMVAPVIIAAGTLIANVLPELLHIFGKDKQAEVATQVIDIAKRVTGKSSEDAAVEKIMQDPNLALQFKIAILDNQKELESLAIQRETLYVSDVQDARKYRDEKLFYLGCVIYVIFFIILAISMVGGYYILNNPTTMDPGMIAAVFGLVGSIVGYVASQAQSVTNFNFGTSYGSMQKGDAISQAVSGMQTKNKQV